MPTLRAMRNGPGSTARWHRPVPHRADVQRHEAPADRAGHDPSRHEGRAAGALDKLLPFQREDFKGIFLAMAGLPVTVRLLDRRCTSSCDDLPARVRDRAPAPAPARRPFDFRAAETLRLLDPELPRDYVDGLAKLQANLEQYRESPRASAALARREAMLRKVHTLTRSTDARPPRRSARHQLPEIYAMQIRGDSRSHRRSASGRASACAPRSWFRRSPPSRN